jgi:uncharacterized protein (DUF362 family)
MKISRRTFGKTLLISGAALAAGRLPSRLPASEAHKSLVAQAVTPRLRRIAHDIQKQAARDCLDLCLLAVTGKSDAAAAWRSLFAPGEKVGIKLSCLPGRPLSSSRGLVAAIVDGLLAAGIDKGDIIVWERTSRELEGAGFTISRLGLKIMGSDELPGGGYSENIEFSGSMGTFFSRIMEDIDALIDVPVLKDHDLAGLSGGMKNMYGAIYNPNKFHANRCDPFVAELCGHPLVRGKMRLVVCDASRVQIQNGPAFFPAYAREYGGMLVSRDPVALDRAGWKIVDSLRREAGLPTLAEAGREPAYIRTAARMGLGQADENLVQMVSV